jgi:methylenetetrahydrofolate--tRNA-(uracil-5-)-methyltransferase
MKANFGILPELEQPVRDKRLRYRAYVERAVQDLRTSIAALNDIYLAEVVA